MKSISGIIVSRVVGFIVLLVLLGIANLLVPTVGNSVFSGIVGFLNSLLLLFFILFFIGLLNDIFWNFDLPFNLIAPIISAVLSIYILNMIFAFTGFIGKYSVGVRNVGIEAFSLSIYILVPMIVILIGYLLIIVRGGKSRYEFERRHRRRNRKERLERQVKKLEKEIKELEWQEVGDEFKRALHNLGKSINRAFEKKEEKRGDRDDENRRTKKKSGSAKKRSGSSKKKK